MKIFDRKNPSIVIEPLDAPDKRQRRVLSRRRGRQQAAGAQWAQEAAGAAGGEQESAAVGGREGRRGGGGEGAGLTSLRCEYSTFNSLGRSSRDMIQYNERLTRIFNNKNPGMIKQ